jgi:hypothetical protein
VGEFSAAPFPVIFSDEMIPVGLVCQIVPIFAQVRPVSMEKALPSYFSLAWEATPVRRSPDLTPFEKRYHSVRFRQFQAIIPQLWALPICLVSLADARTYFAVLQKTRPARPGAGKGKNNKGKRSLEPGSKSPDRKRTARQD